MGGGALLSALMPAGAAAKGGKGLPPASFGKGDVGILNYALTLEYLEAAFYNQATAEQGKRKFVKGKQSQIFLKTVTADENAHVKFLKKALGKKATASPNFDFGNAFTSESNFLELAFTFENTGVHAYSGQALNIQSPAYVAAAPLDPHGRGASRFGRRPDHGPHAQGHRPRRALRHPADGRAGPQGGRRPRGHQVDPPTERTGATMPNIGPMEILVVLIIALVVFGPKRLPELGNSLGNGIREFKGTISGEKAEETHPPKAIAGGETIGEDAARQSHLSR
jgi:TatA/E family protein of Tat protein translocase